MKIEFANKTVLVTGAGQGAGKAIAQGFYDAGAIVIAADLTEPSWAVEGKDSRLFPLAMDVSDEVTVIESLGAITKKAGAINILVNNAGIAVESPIQDFKLDVWNKIFNVNVNGTFLCTRFVVQHLLKENIGGRIINIASIAGKNGFPNSSGYCASKSAVIGFTRSLAAELGGHDITVNAICPGSIDTPMIQAVIAKISKNTGLDLAETRTMMESGIPMKRFQQPEEVAALVLFLASDYAKNINGEAMNLDGGVVRD